MNASSQMDRRLALVGMAVGLAGCFPTAASPRGTDGRRRPQIVLVAIDGVRWQDVFLGADPKRMKKGLGKSRRALVPSLTRMEESGVSLGAPHMGGFHASGPNFVSLPGYMEMLSGVTNTGCYNNGCRRMNRPSLLDDYAESPGAHPASAAVFSSWPKIEFAASAKERGIVSAGRHGGYNLGAMRRFRKSHRLMSAARSARGMEGAAEDFRPDALTAQLAQTFLLEANPDFLFVSLGETDEFAHLNDYPKYLEALSAADRFVGSVRRILRRSSRATALFVTTDHGRARGFRDHGSEHPESSRSFLFAEGSLIRKMGPIRANEPAYLCDIAPTVRSMAGLRQRTGGSSGRPLEELLRSTG